MELSACIVVYNGAEEALRAAQTVLDCTRRHPLTLYLVDNASPDGSGQRLTRAAAERCENHDLTDCMVIGISAIVDTELDGAVGMNSGIFNNPFLIWGKYRKTLFKTTLKLSFQFHHTQMDGAHAGRFLQRLQETIDSLRAGGARHGAFGLLR